MNGSRNYMHTRRFYILFQSQIEILYLHLQIRCTQLFAMLPIFMVILLVGSSQELKAHGDLDKRIKEATAEIKIAPDSSYLFFKRGRLYYEHEEYQKAINDLQQANKLGYEDLFGDLIYAKSYQRLGNHQNALQHIRRILRKQPNHLIAMKTKAELVFEQEKFKESALLFEKVIEKSRTKLPDNYLAAAQSWERLNSKKGNKKAVAILEKGIEHLGALIVFREAKRELYIRLKKYEEALVVQEEIIAAANRKEMPYYKAAEICLLTDNKIQAKTYLEQSMNALNKLSISKQNIPAMKLLKQNIEQIKRLL